MIIFESVKKHYATLGICLSDQSIQKNLLNERVCFGFILYGCLILSQFVYIFCVANGFMEYLVCICSTSANIIIFVFFAAIVFRKTALFEFIDDTEKLIDARCKYPETKAFFLKTNRQVERLCEIVFVIMKMALQLAIFPICIASFVIYFMTDSGCDSFQLPIPLWFPFDWSNPFGYLIAIILEYIITAYIYVIIACTLSLAIDGYWFAYAATNEFQRFLPLINEKAQANANESNELTLLLSESLDAQGLVKKLIHDFSDIFQPIVMSLFAWSLLAISCAMLFIQVEIVHHENIMPMMLMIFCGICALTTVFIACEIGQRLNDKFDGIDFTIEQWDWYLFPIEMKRMLPMIIAFAQRRVELECVGSITCGREVFRKIINRAYSYFTVLRQLGD